MTKKDKKTTVEKTIEFIGRAWDLYVRDIYLIEGESKHHHIGCLKLTGERWKSNFFNKQYVNDFVLQEVNKELHRLNGTDRETILLQAHKGIPSGSCKRTVQKWAVRNDKGSYYTYNNYWKSLDYQITMAQNTEEWALKYIKDLKLRKAKPVPIWIIITDKEPEK
jgi:hypothetical protein